MPKILLVDDSRDLRETLSTLLTMKGYQVAIAHENDDLVGSVRSINPDIILLHVGMQNQDGRDICMAISREYGKNMPVILTSGDYELLSHFREYGAIDYLEKPYELSLLLNKLEKAFTRQ
jgi:DNA-binding response OmpR family regulator